MNNRNNIIDWLLEGDVSIQYQTHRYLLKSESGLQQKLQKRIETEGWGARFLSLQRNDGHWGRAFYQPKWTSTHYTLLDLRNLGLPPDNANARKIILRIFEESIGADGGVNYSVTLDKSDICLNGMVLNYISYFQVMDEKLESVIDYLLRYQISDGGWNCEHWKGAVHSSLHTTLSVLEGLQEYKINGGRHRIDEIEDAEIKGIEFILKHHLFKSHRTGEVIKNQFITLSYPSRWKYDILRALDYFRDAEVSYDNRMDDAIEVLIKKRRKDRRWNLQANHPGQVHFEMEQVGQPSRWNTLRAMRVLDYFGIE